MSQKKRDHAGLIHKQAAGHKELSAKGGRNKALPEELKKARKTRRVDIEVALEKFLSMSEAERKAYAKSPEATGFEQMVLKIIEKGISQGDHSRLSFLLDNWVGPVAKKIEAVVSPHKSLVEELEDE